MNINSNWMHAYQIACNYYKNYSNLLVPSKDFYQNFFLGGWISKQRSSYKAKKLSSNQIILLEKLEMVWDVKEFHWNENFLLATAFFTANGHLNVPSDYKADCEPLGRWLDTQRDTFKKGRLQQTKIELLNSLNMIWDKYDKQWEDSYLIAKEFYNKTGHLILPAKTLFKDFTLGQWISQQRKAYKQGIMKSYRIEQLEKIDMIWSELDYNWEVAFLIANDFFIENGHLLVPKKFKFKNTNLGSWLGTQRSEKARGAMSLYRIQKLDAIKMDWNPQSTNQTSFAEQTVFYYISQAFPSAQNRFKEFGFELDIYIPELNIAIEYDSNLHINPAKDIKKNVKCNEKEILLLRIREPLCPALNSSSIDFILKNLSHSELANILMLIFEYIIENLPALSLNIPKIDIQNDSKEILDNYINHLDSIWEKNFKLVEAYYLKHGNLNFSRNHSIGSFRPNIWLSRQRHLYKEKMLPQIKIEKLEFLNILWNVLDDKWDLYVLELENFKSLYGHVDVPQRFVTANEVTLGTWVSNQRLQFNKGKLSEERKQILDEFNFSWVCKEDPFDKNFAYAQEYYIKNGHLLVPRFEKVNGFKLGFWIYEQRKFYNKPKNARPSSFTEERIQRLSSIGMCWDLLDQKWETKFLLAKEYFNKYGNLLIPDKFQIKGVNLGIWIRYQRRMYRENKLSTEKINLLEEINMLWKIR